MPSGGDDKPKLQLFIENSFTSVKDIFKSEETKRSIGVAFAFIVLLTSFVLFCLSLVAPAMNIKIAIILFVALTVSAIFLWRNI